MTAKSYFKPKLTRKSKVVTGFVVLIFCLILCMSIDVNPVYCYILKCSKGGYYTGITKDINKRLSQHNKGKSISTRHRGTKSVVYLKTCPTRKDARKLEVHIKKVGARKYLIRENHLYSFQ